MQSPHPMVAEGDLFKVHTEKYYWYNESGMSSALMEPDDFILVIRSDPDDHMCTAVHNGRTMTIDKHTLWQTARLEKP